MPRSVEVFYHGELFNLSYFAPNNDFLSGTHLGLSESNKLFTKPTSKMNISQDAQISCSSATSSSVKTPRDESVGSIKEFMFNTTTGKVDFVVLKVDEGFLNLGSKLLALPFESFEFNTAQDDIVIVKESKETLENAPGFDKDNWPSGPQSEFLHSMRSYYSEKTRSLNGRYDHMNRSFFNEGNTFDSDRNEFDSDRTTFDTDRNTFDSERNTIQDRQFGDGFLEQDHNGERQSDIRRGGKPLL